MCSYTVRTSSILSKLSIQCIYSIFLYLNVFQCLLPYANIAHANMLFIYLFSFKCIFYFCVLYFCVKGNLQIKNFIAWCKLCVYDN